LIKTAWNYSVVDPNFKIMTHANVTVCYLEKPQKNLFLVVRPLYSYGNLQQKVLEGREFSGMDYLKTPRALEG